MLTGCPLLQLCGHPQGRWRGIDADVDMSDDQQVGAVWLWGLTSGRNKLQGFTKFDCLLHDTWPVTPLTATPGPLQDITRGRDMVDSLFQGFGAGVGGTHNAVLSSTDYLSTAMRSLGNIEDGFYIAPGEQGWTGRGAQAVGELRAPASMEGVCACALAALPCPATPASPRLASTVADTPSLCAQPSLTKWPFTLPRTSWTCPRSRCP